MEQNQYLLLVLFIWNLTVFFLYAMDKYRARNGSWRVSERTLILCSFCAGGIGAMAGMLFLRHKTRHFKFRILIPVSMMLTVAVVLFAFNPEYVVLLLELIHKEFLN